MSNDLSMGVAHIVMLLAILQVLRIYYFDINCNNCCDAITYNKILAKFKRTSLIM